MRKIKKFVRTLVDNFYSKNLAGKVAVGKSDYWTIIETGLQNPMVISGGAGKDISFELEMIQRYNATVLLFDPSPTGQETLNNLDPKPENLNYYPIGLAKEDGNVSFDLPENPLEGSFRLTEGKEPAVEFECKSVTTIAKENNISHIDVLKIDIEGFEYEVLDDILSSDITVTQICVEYHHFFDYIDKQSTIDTMNKLKKAGYKLFHRHGLDYSYILETSKKHL